MTLAELERLVAASPPGSLLPRDWFLEQLRELGPTETETLSDLSVVGAGQVLARSPSTIREYCRAGLLPGAYRQRGREWRIPRAAIRSFQRAESEPLSKCRPVRAEDVDLGAWREEVA